MSQKRMFEVKCTDCGKTATVPFEPTKGKPVYCKSCFSKHRSKKTTFKEPIKFDMKNAWARRGAKSKERKAKRYSVFERS